MADDGQLYLLTETATNQGIGSGSAIAGHQKHDMHAFFAARNVGVHLLPSCTCLGCYNVVVHTT